ncbi:MAG: type II toxin-antitoxin system antitoxin SocA domain-containing protein [Candidatus Saccharimonadales bacterium]
MSKTLELAERILEWREQAGLTQQEVADRLGLSRQRYILVEKGERDLNTTELGILSDLFGITPEDFFRQPVDIPKFRQMYFACIKFAADGRGGVPKTKLAKLLYLADFTNFFKELEPMSGVKYRRMEYGPVADVFFSLTDDLYQTGKIDITPLERAQIISVTTREADNFDKLSAEELALIKEICEQWKDKRTEEIVNFTHEQLPWQICRDGEFIPYELIIQEEPDNVFKPATR